MSDPTNPGEMYLAPAARRARLELPGARTAELPAVDEHAVGSESGQEMIRGQIVRAAPSYAPHADRQVDIAYVLRASVASGYVASVELLTRTAHDYDFATDACVRKAGTDSQGHRYLEELSFEVKHTQSNTSLKDRARQLVRRGVRRVFAIHVRGDKSGGHERVKAGPVKEWSPDRQEWHELSEALDIEDRCLARPLNVRALLNAAEADRAVIQALAAKGDPTLAKLTADSYDRGRSDGYDRGRSDGYDRGRSDGLLQGLRRTVRELCELLAIELTPDRQGHIDSLDAEALERLCTDLKQNRCWGRDQE